MRGHPSSYLIERIVIGSIPADAGPPIEEGNLTAAIEVYPRGCGATSATSATAGLREGLSPRMRGHRLPLNDALKQVRSIPADAGPPGQRALCGQGRWVYPRGCGATVDPDSNPISLCGLSPRMRGHPQIQHFPLGHDRSIPADAGPPGQGAYFRHAPRVYPRGCGATRSRRRRAPRSRGLSPRMRGHLRGQSRAW